MELSKMLALNAEHVKRSTWRKIVDNEIEPLTVGKMTYPRTDNIAAQLIYFDKKRFTEYVESGEVPTDLMRCLFFAADMKVNVLRFSADCAYLPYLPAYRDDNAIRLATTRVAARIDTVLTINSSHITQETDQALDQGMGSTSFTPYKKLIDGKFYGRIVYPGTPINETAKQTNLKKVPGDLLMCAALAKTVGADAICFDSDGPVVEQLPVYTWDN